MRRHSILWLGSCSAAVGLFLALFVGSSTQAASCLSQPLNSVAEAGANGRGVRVLNPGMRVYDAFIDCGRASSIWVRNELYTSVAEVGWYENPTGIYDCPPTTTGEPRKLAFALLNGNTYDCYHPGGTLNEGIRDFRVDDDNQNGIWNFYYEGSNFWDSFDMGNFKSGIVETNGERLSSGGDTARAVFDGLQRRDGQGWDPWANATKDSIGSDDNDFTSCLYTATHIEVKQVGSC